MMITWGYEMSRFYLKWNLTSSATPSDPEQRVKLWLSMLEMVKADMKAGKLKDWGMCNNGGSGYAIYEEANDADLFINLLKWMPHITFDAKPVLTVDETVAAIKKSTGQTKETDRRRDR
jgi:hypothetical protein